MGRLKIIQEDDSVKRIAYLEDVQPLAEDLDDLIDEVENKVDKVEGKSLLADAEITRLSGIETGANKTTIANTLTETIVGKALDATQGKVLNEKIGDLGDDFDTHKKATTPHTYGERFAWAYNETEDSLDLVVI